MKRNLMIITFVLFALPVIATAQGSGSSGGGNQPSRPPSSEFPRSEASERPFVVTRMITAKIAEVDVEAGTMVLEKDGKLSKIKIDRRTKLKADKKTEVGSKKNLSLADFGVGQTVRVIYIPSEDRIVEVRLRYEKS